MLHDVKWHHVNDGPKRGAALRSCWTGGNYGLGTCSARTLDRCLAAVSVSSCPLAAVRTAACSVANEHRPQAAKSSFLRDM